MKDNWATTDSQSELLLPWPAGHCVECVEGGGQFLVRQPHQQAVVLHPDLVDGLPFSLLQPPFHLSDKVLHSRFRWVY